MKNILFLFIVLLMFSGCDKKETDSSYTKKGTKSFHQKGLERKNPLEKDDLKRTALVVGNNDYSKNDPNFSPLKNAVNDAKAVKERLKRFGFEVVLLEDAEFLNFDNAVLHFGKKLKKNGGTGFFFYSGHAVQHNGINYFIPVGRPIQRDYELTRRAVSMQRVADEMKHSGNRFNIIVVDACRNQLTENFFERTKGQKKPNPSLTSMKPPKGMCILFATAENRFALEKEEDTLGVFTKHFVTNMVEENVPLWKVFQRTSEAVAKETNSAQIPWIESSGIHEFYFNPVNLEQKIKEAKEKEENRVQKELLAVRKKAEKRKASILSEVENLKNQQEISEKKSLQAEKEYEKRKSELARLEEERKQLEKQVLDRKNHMVFSFSHKKEKNLEENLIKTKKLIVAVTNELKKANALGSKKDSSSFGFSAHVLALFNAVRFRIDCLIYIVAERISSDEMYYFNQPPEKKYTLKFQEIINKLEECKKEILIYYSVQLTLLEKTKSLIITYQKLLKVEANFFSLKRGKMQHAYYSYDRDRKKRLKEIKELQERSSKSQKENTEGSLVEIVKFLQLIDEQEAEKVEELRIKKDHLGQKTRKNLSPEMSNSKILEYFWLSHEDEFFRIDDVLKDFYKRHSSIDKLNLLISRYKSFRRRRQRLKTYIFVCAGKLENIRSFYYPEPVSVSIEDLSKLVSLKRLEYLRLKIVEDGALRDILKFRFLKKLTLESPVSEEDFKSISKSRTLETLELEDVSKFKWLYYFKKMENLKYLKFRRFNFKGLPFLVEFSNLKGLSISTNSSSKEEIEILGNMKNLKKLDLRNLSISQSRDLSFLKNLEYLSLSFLQEIDLSSKKSSCLRNLSKLKGLKLLYLHKGTAENLNGLTVNSSLVDLDIRVKSVVKKFDLPLEVARRLKNLKMSTLSRSTLSKDFLIVLKNSEALECLKLSGFTLSSEEIKIICNFRNLRCLDLSGCFLRMETEFLTEYNLEDLEEINLKASDVFSLPCFLNPFSGTKTLKKVSIKDISSGYSFNDFEIFTKLTSLVSLSLDFSRTFYHFRVLEQLEQCYSLRELYLGELKINLEVIKYLSKIKSLRKIRIKRVDNLLYLDVLRLALLNCEVLLVD